MSKTYEVFINHQPMNVTGTLSDTCVYSKKTCRNLSFDGPVAFCSYGTTTREPECIFTAEHFTDGVPYGNIDVSLQTTTNVRIQYSIKFETAKNSLVYSLEKHNTHYKNFISMHPSCNVPFMVTYVCLTGEKFNHTVNFQTGKMDVSIQLTNGVQLNTLEQLPFNAHRAHIFYLTTDLSHLKSYINMANVSIKLSDELTAYGQLYSHGLNYGITVDRYMSPDGTVYKVVGRQTYTPISSVPTQLTGLFEITNRAHAKLIAYLENGQPATRQTSDKYVPPNHPTVKHVIGQYAWGFDTNGTTFGSGAKAVLTHGGIRECTLVDGAITFMPVSVMIRREFEEMVRIALLDPVDPILAVKLACEYAESLSAALPCIVCSQTIPASYEPILAKCTVCYNENVPCFACATCAEGTICVPCSLHYRVTNHRVPR